MHIVLVYFAIKYNGNWDAIYQALEKKEKVSLEEMKKIEKEISEKRWKLVTILDHDYPKQLKAAYKPPFVLWYKGNKDILKENFITVTGNQLDIHSEKRIKNLAPKVLEKKPLLQLHLKE